MGKIGEGLRALEPDVVVIAANDHLENFMVDCVPPFTLHAGPSASGSFAGRKFAWPVASDLSMQLVQYLQDEGFDPAFSLAGSISYEFAIPLTFCGFGPETTLLPIYVNSYIAPQPSSERCYAFGQALGRGMHALGKRAVIISSGGLSHYPGTERYSSPDVTTDEDLVDRIGAGNLRSIVAMDNAALDRTGNVEARSWAILAGALGERKPDETLVEMSWHHNYVLFGWTEDQANPEATSEGFHYPPLRSDRLELTKALYELRMTRDSRERYLADASAYASEFDLSAEEGTALEAMDEDELQRMGIHPLLVFICVLQLNLDRERQTHVPSA
jgi:2,3-dihydroxyphenylpropionate 1,2-dioxygenase